jgi:uncharacterized RDD family membrane protein YckC/Tfp pilus assembly major pilin PilA
LRGLKKKEIPVSQNHALVLTGEVSPGFAPDAVWAQLAAWLRMEPGQFAQLVACTPRIIRQDSDLGKLQGLQASIAQTGAEVEICAMDGSPPLYVLIDGTPRGPMPGALAAQRIAQGRWADTVQVAEPGAAWKPWRESSAAAAKPPPAPDAAPAELARWAPPAAPLVGGSGASTRAWDTLPAGEAIHAGFWRRVAAYIIDGLVISIPSFVVNIVPILGFLVSLVGRWLYFSLMESSSWQATLGKRAMGIKVTDAQGQRVSFGVATGRYFGAALSYIIFWIGYMMAGWTERKQGLHDMMAGTFVVFNPVQPSQPLPVERPPMPWYGWLVNILFVLLIPVGILAAIALPAYQDYTARSRVSQILDSAKPLQQAVASQGCQDGGNPDSPHQWVAQVEVGVYSTSDTCAIILTLAESQDVPYALRGKSIDLVQNESGGWNCTSDDISRKDLPTRCRD